MCTLVVCGCELIYTSLGCQEGKSMRLVNLLLHPDMTRCQRSSFCQQALHLNLSRPHCL